MPGCVIIHEQNICIQVLYKRVGGKLGRQRREEKKTHDEHAEAEGAEGNRYHYENNLPRY